MNKKGFTIAVIAICIVIVAAGGAIFYLNSSFSKLAKDQANLEEVAKEEKDRQIKQKEKDESELKRIAEEREQAINDELEASLAKENATEEKRRKERQAEEEEQMRQQSLQQQQSSYSSYNDNGISEWYRQQKLEELQRTQELIEESFRDVLRLRQLGHEGFPDYQMARSNVQIGIQSKIRIANELGDAQLVRKFEREKENFERQF